MSGRRDFPHTMNVKMREWEACHATDRKIRVSLDSTSARASLGLDSTKARASERPGSAPPGGGTSGRSGGISGTVS